MGSNLKLIVLESLKEFGEKVDNHLKKIYKTDKSFIISIDQVRFSDGEGKIKLRDSVRAKDVYIMCDVHNYSVTYKAFGKDHIMGPDEHYQDIKRTISAIRGNAERISIMMPFLYQSRQHLRNGRESLDCALALQELESLGVHNIITFDAHDPNIQNAIPLLPFDNFFPTNTILEQFLNNEEINYNNLQVISPDVGAMKRSRYFANMLECDLGLFYKRRDYSKVVDGKNPVIEHKYLGRENENLEYIIVDDMIASGGSVIDILEELHKKKAKRAYIIATFALFTDGIAIFDKAYKKGLLTKLYTTNLTYIPNEYKNCNWLEIVDCSNYTASIIDAFHKKKSVSPLMNGKKEFYKKIEKIKKGNNS